MLLLIGGGGAEAPEEAEVAATIILFDTTKSVPRNIDRFGRMLIEALEGLIATRDVILQQRDGADNAGNVTNYALVTSQGGYVQGGYASANDAARGSFLELDSLLTKLNTDASVSNVRTAIYQFAAKHGII